jgi:hypothetical protein
MENISQHLKQQIESLIDKRFSDVNGILIEQRVEEKFKEISSVILNNLKREFNFILELDSSTKKINKKKCEPISKLTKNLVKVEKSKSLLLTSNIIKKYKTNRIINSNFGKLNNSNLSSQLLTSNLNEKRKPERRKQNFQEKIVVNEFLGKLDESNENNLNKSFFEDENENTNLVESAITSFFELYDL